jgi:hypothetical protein
MMTQPLMRVEQFAVVTAAPHQLTSYGVSLSRYSSDEKQVVQRDRWFISETIRGHLFTN